MSKGIIRLLVEDRGYGFIMTEQRENLFFQESNLRGVDFSSLREGQEVEFEVTEGGHGRLEADKVRFAKIKSE